LEDDPHALVAKMSDFGLAVVLDEGLKEQYLRQPQATRWCSPETVAYGKLSYQSDVWAFGATLWELFADGASPWVALEKRADVTSKLNSLADGGELTTGSDLSLDFPLSSEACPPAAYSILLSCLQVGEDARPTAAELAESLEIVFDEEAPPIVLCADTENSIGSSAVANLSLDESGDAESTSASTEASLSDRQPIPKTLMRQLSSKLLEADVDSRNSKCEVLSEFLWSESAVGTLGAPLVRNMRKEVRQYTSDRKMVRQALRREDFLTSLAEDKPCTSDVGHLGDVECKCEAEVQASGVLTCEAEVQSAETPIRELLLPLVSKEGRLRCWGSAPPLSIWTLWSLAEDDALSRRDYASEAAARAALQAEGVGGAFVQQAIYSS
jgi:serine/threonine protein kinase